MSALVIVLIAVSAYVAAVVAAWHARRSCRAAAEIRQTFAERLDTELAELLDEGGRP